MWCPNSFGPKKLNLEVCLHSFLQKRVTQILLDKEKVCFLFNSKLGICLCDAVCPRTSLSSQDSEQRGCHVVVKISYDCQGGEIWYANVNWGRGSRRRVSKWESHTYGDRPRMKSAWSGPGLFIRQLSLKNIPAIPMARVN